MPFACGFDNGRLKLTASREHSYTILGEREQRPFTVCTGKGTAACRTLMVHRFNIQCEGISVPWARVIAALDTLAGRRAWIDGAVLNIENQVGPREGDARPCAEASPMPQAHAVPAAADCLPWKPKAVVEKMKLPAGFAPVGEAGARFLFEEAAKETAASVLYVAAAGEAESAASEMAAAASPAADHAGSAISREPLPELDGSAADAGAGEAWPAKIRVRREKAQLAAEAPALASGAWGSMLAGFLFALAAVGVAVAAGWRKGLFSLAVLERVRAQAGNAAAPDGARGAAPQGSRRDGPLNTAAEQVGALLAETEKAVLLLRSGTPLRDVLEEEAHVMSRRLTVLRATMLDEDAVEEKLGAQFRALMRDLERVRRIASSAARSLSGASREATIMPTSKSEAYDVLGVNADAEETALKKLVDALRMTWHPDHARDEADREVREVRIKQINIAWDLINDRRRAA